MGKLTGEQLDAMRSFIAARDRQANILGQVTIAFEKQKAHCMQQIELINHREQEYIAAVARDHGIDPNQTYGLDFHSGELKVKE